MRALLPCLVSAVVVISSFSAISASTHGAGLNRQHLGRARSADNVALSKTVHLAKRFDSAKFTFYDAGLGACGKVNSRNDSIVALNLPQWDGGSHCFETITITYNGKSIQAQITDQCPICPFGGLDLSRGLFDKFAAEEVGVIYGSWVYGGGEEPKPPKQDPPEQNPPEQDAPKQDPPKSSKAPKPSSSPALESTSKVKPTPTPSSSSSSKTRLPSSSASSTSAAPSTTVSESQVVTSTSSSEPIATGVAQPSTEVLSQFNQAFLQMAGLVGAASQS